MSGTSKHQVIKDLSPCAMRASTVLTVQRREHRVDEVASFGEGRVTIKRQAMDEDKTDSSAMAF